MGSRTSPWTLAALLLGGPLLAIGGAAPVSSETLVEGHTVFVEMGLGQRVNASAEEYYAAVAVLVREEVLATSLLSPLSPFAARDESARGAAGPSSPGLSRGGAWRFPGVLWFDDQYLVNPLAARGQIVYRYPCYGAVFAVPEGAPAPIDAERRLVDDAAYAESYYITDPNDHAWFVDKWLRADGSPVWSVPILNNVAGYAREMPDVCRDAAFRDTRCPSGPSLDGRCARPVPGYAYDYPCGFEGQECHDILYNALLVIPMADVAAVAAAAKNHTLGSDDMSRDVAACHGKYVNGTYWQEQQWHCPEGDDDREGNSHPFNPFAAGFADDSLEDVAADFTRRRNHGGSAACEGGVVESCHAVANIEVYHGWGRDLLERRFTLVDVDGSSAPYRCPDGTGPCAGHYAG